MRVFSFVCKKCIVVTKNRCSDMETDSVNNVIKSDIINSIDTKLETINSNMNKLLLNTTTYKTYSEAITNSLDPISLGINKIDSRNKNIIANNKEIKTNHTNDDMRKSDYINTSTEDKNNEYKLVIRNIEKANCNINYINNIFLLFTSLFNKRLFMAHKINLINSNFNKLLILSFLSKQIIKYGKILYHSTKSNLVNEKKCVFNYKSNIYELQSIINNKINWYKKTDVFF